MAEFGEILGSAVSQNFDQQTNDLFKYDEMRKRTQAQNEAKAALFAQDLDFQNAMNEYDNPRVKAFAEQQIQKIGQFAKNNPDYLSNPIKMGQLKMMKNELKSNPVLLRGLAVDKEYAKYLEDRKEALKNPNQWDQEALDAQGKAFNNYFKTGNPSGLAGLQAEGEQPALYTRPQMFVNLPDTLLKAGNSINPSLVTKGNNLGEYTRTADPAHIKSIKDAIYQEHGRQVQVEARKLGLNTPEQVDKWLTDGIEAGVKTTYDPGDLNALWERGMRQKEFNQRQGKIDAKANVVSPGSAYYTLFDKKKPSGMLPSDIAQKVFGDKPKLIVVGNNRAQIDLTGHKMNYDNRYMTDGKGTVRATGFVDMSLEDAKLAGIYSEDATTSISDVEGAAANMPKVSGKGITSEYLGKAKVVNALDSEGKTVPSSVRIFTSIPLDKNDDSAKQLYDTHLQPDKLVNPLETDEGSGQPQQQAQSNVPTGTKAEFVSAGWSEADIKQGLSEGKIKIK